MQLQLAVQLVECHIPLLWEEISFFGTKGIPSNLLAEINIPTYLQCESHLGALRQRTATFIRPSKTGYKKLEKLPQTLF